MEQAFCGRTMLRGGGALCYLCHVMEELPVYYKRAMWEGHLMGKPYYDDWALRFVL